MFGRTKGRQALLELSESIQNEIYSCFDESVEHFKQKPTEEQLQRWFMTMDKFVLSTDERINSEAVELSTLLFTVAKHLRKELVEK